MVKYTDEVIYIGDILSSFCVLDLTLPLCRTISAVVSRTTALKGPALLAISTTVPRLHRERDRESDGGGEGNKGREL
jgi:hypothetical protein